MNLKQSFLSTPGPTTLKEAVKLYFKGVAMGAADIIPGVSGGTIALIAGIYSNLIDGIKSLDFDAVKKLARFDLSGFVAHVHLKFLVILLAGIATAILSVARGMHWLLENQPTFTWSAFFGLILASIWVLSQKVEWSLFRVGGFVAGGLVGFFVVGMIPVATPETWWFLVLCGMIAICAMILPGISGAFLLLILGKYEFVTGALKHPFSAESLVIILCFGIGAFMGITSFSRVLSYLLHHYEAFTLAFLTGLMTGSLRKVWPWKDVLETQIIRGKTYVLREANVLPMADMNLAICLGLMLVALVLVLRLEKVAQ